MFYLATYIWFNIPLLAINQQLSEWGVCSLVLTFMTVLLYIKSSVSVKKCSEGVNKRHGLKNNWIKSVLPHKDP